jgi:hypothetical protein
MKVIILKELFKLIFKELKIIFKTRVIPILFKVLYLLKNYSIFIISIAAIIISIMTLYKVNIYQKSIDKKLLDMKEMYEPLQGKIKKFNETYLEEIK